MDRVIFWLEQGASPQQSQCRRFILQPFKGLTEPLSPTQLLVLLGLHVQPTLLIWGWEEKLFSFVLFLPSMSQQECWF